ncbi:hypothetical protein BURC_04214 [Burkholderiaceae bacterium]|nr:hypothetical protein BURC_04214 [Burkholderiaceae bacterium]
MTSSTADRLQAALGAAITALALLGGAPAAASSLAAEEAALARAQPKDRTLHRLQAGVHAMRENRLDAAAGHFDEALGSIESVFSNAEGAARARSLWYEEGAKDFKGEPYERAMAYYYRGLIYLADADYENARASFRTALMQSSFAEEQQYRSGFATLMFLEGWANQLLADPQAAESYAEASKYRKDLPTPAAGANTLVIAELAGSPRKVGDGIGNHEIVYRRAKRTPEKRVDLAFGSQPAQRLYAMEDLYVQATHRGPRAIDRIIAGKVVFQEGTGTIGDTLGTLASEGAVINAGLGGSAGAALGGVAAVGAIASLLATNVKPRADVRYWANLPETLHIATTRTSGDTPSTVTLFDEAGQPVAADTLVQHQWTDRNGNRLVWIKTRQ